MSSSDDLTVAKLFDDAYDLQQRLESDRIDGNTETYKLLLDRLKLAEEKLDELHLFSDNEEIDEISTNELRYFILYALIGWAYEFRVSVREERSADVQLALSYWIKYLKLCQNYGLIKTIPSEQSTDQEPRRLPSREERQIKIDKLQRKRNLELLIERLRPMAHMDDATKRELNLQLINWWIAQAEEEISALKEEQTLLQFSKEPSSFNEQRTTTTATSSSKANKLPVDGPFTIMTTKDRLYKEAIGGAGYPSLPTMTVEEFYDDLTARQAAQPPPVVKPAPKSDEVLNETDDPTHRQTVRQVDEFKDENPRGAGNRYNRS